MSEVRNNQDEKTLKEHGEGINSVKDQEYLESSIESSGAETETDVNSKTESEEVADQEERKLM